MVELLGDFSLQERPGERSAIIYVGTPTRTFEVTPIGTFGGASTATSGGTHT